MQRRGFLNAILAAGMAPAIAKAGILMSVRQIWIPNPSMSGWTNVYAPEGRWEVMNQYGQMLGTVLIPVGTLRMNDVLKLDSFQPWPVKA